MILAPKKRRPSMCEGRRDRSALPALFARHNRAGPLLFLNAESCAARYRIARGTPEPCSRPLAPPVFSRSGSLWTRCLPLLFPSSPLCFIISARARVCQAHWHQDAADSTIFNQKVLSLRNRHVTILWVIRFLK